MRIFTFDDGPSEWTDQILDLLAEHHARALFFVTGMRAQERPETVMRAYLGGHGIGNHGWSHARLTRLTDGEVRDELDRTSRFLESLTGSRPTLFRAPFFGTDDRVNKIAESLGMTHVGASIVPDDWATNDHEAVAGIVLSELQPDSVVSLHDGIPPDGGSSMCTASRQPTVEAVRLILEELAVRA